MIDELDLEDWLAILRPDWMHEGACTLDDQELFFPAPGRGVKTVHESQVLAARICAGCPVRETCLEYALDNSIVYGVWGGESERSRRKLRRARRLAA